MLKTNSFTKANQLYRKHQPAHRKGSQPNKDCSAIVSNNESKIKYCCNPGTLHRHWSLDDKWWPFWSLTYIWLGRGISMKNDAWSLILKLHIGYSCGTIKRYDEDKQRLWHLVLSYLLVQILCRIPGSGPDLNQHFKALNIVFKHLRCHWGMNYEAPG